jgi:hypothetical protein
MAPRFTVSPAGAEDFRYWIIVDTVAQRIIAQSFSHPDAEFVNAKVNTACGEVKPPIRALLATELCDFRMQLERENGGPLVGDPSLAFFFEDMCRFFGFNTGERALVLGRDLLVTLDEFDQPVESDELVIIQV